MAKKILVIDDEDDVRKVFHRILTRAGYGVIEASNGYEALEKLESESVDLIMLDKNMPRMNGLEFLRQIRSKEITPAPVLMVSGSSGMTDRVESYQLGVYDFIKKPEEPEVMLKRVENGIKIGEMIHFNEFMKIELLMAKKLQKYLYPESGLETDHLTIDIWSEPLSDIGGDLYDYIHFMDGKVLLFVGDVTGHSISAALFTAIVKMVFRNAIKVSLNPGGVMTVMNRDLYENLPLETFVTMFFCLIKPDEGVIEYTNAGHPGPFCLKNGKVFQLGGGDSFLGPIQEASFQTFTVGIDEIDTMYICTDGVLEILDEEERPLGKGRILDILDGKGGPGDKFLRIQETATDTRWKITDDRTVMMVNFKK